MFKNMKIGKKLYVLLTLTFILICILAAHSLMSYSALNENHDEDRNILVLYTKAVDTARNSQVHFKKQVQEWKDILLRGTDKAAFEKYHNNFSKESDETQTNLKELKDILVKLGDDTSMVDDAVKKHGELKDKYLEALKSYNPAEADAYQKVDRMVKGMDRPPTESIESIVKFIKDKQTETTSKKKQHSVEEYWLLFWITISGVVVGMFLLFAAAFLIIRSITGPMAKAVDVSNRLADGDLTVTVEAGCLDCKDETGELFLSLNNMIEKLRTVIGNIRKAAGDLAAESQQLSVTSEQTSRGVVDQMERANQIAASSEEMSKTVIDIANNASGIASSASETAKMAKNGEEVVNSSAREVRAIAETVSESARFISSLGDRSKEIGEIVNVINDIADQTNLLALNAAIEAARAGEQGRGFAVVADEVRKLAERTATATSQISGMIGGIQKDVSKAVSSMDEATKRVETGVEYVTNAGSALNDIVQGVNSLQSMVQQIATATEEMSTVSETITSDIATIANVSKDTSASSGQIANSASGLSSLSAGLQELVSQFRVGSTGDFDDTGKRTLRLA
ncbi:MAG: methyl-accepting chemotaxis protein [Nitrospirae bacterium]|nr:methyl-accepting chemotaxis protein [Nitrospirota bacterium]